MSALGQAVASLGDTQCQESEQIKNCPVCRIPIIRRSLSEISLQWKQDVAGSWQACVHCQ